MILDIVSNKELLKAVLKVMEEIQTSLMLNQNSRFARLSLKKNIALRLDILDRLEFEKVLSVEEVTNGFAKVIINKNNFDRYLAELKVES